MVNTGFEYLETQTVEQLEKGVWEHKGNMAQSIIEIGARLIIAKNKLNHGEWGKWLEEKVEISHRTANNWMKVANEFADSQAISNLEGTKVVMLLDVPVDMRDQFMEQNDIKKMTTREMKQAIKDLKKINVSDEIYDGVHELDICDLNDFPKHEKYFPNLIGNRWMRFLNNIQRNGVLEPILITIDNLIISGHQRVRACRDLGIEKINVVYLKVNKNRPYDEQIKRAFCCGNCTRGQMELYKNALIMMGLEDGVAMNPLDIMNKNINKVEITEMMRQQAYDIVQESNKISELYHLDEMKQYDVYDIFYNEFDIDANCLNKHLSISGVYGGKTLSEEAVIDIIDTYADILEDKLTIIINKSK